jgi:hypothetical protein
MSARYVKITKDGQEGECLPESVKGWERHGWTVVDDGSSESAPEAPVAEPQTPDGRTKTKE